MANKKATVGIQDLIDRTTGPQVKATVTVNQPYAQDQHETLFYRHPRGGRAKFLELPLYENATSWVNKFANRLLVRGARTDEEWGKVGRELAKSVSKNAPLEFGDLRNSAGLVVKAGSRVVITEPPKQPRLSDAELDAKDYMRNMGLGYR